MLASIKDWFEAHLLSSNTGEGTDILLRRAAAVLLCEIMHADHAVDSAEQSLTLAAMQNFLAMSPEDARALYDEVEVLMQDALSLQQFTSLLNEHYDEEKKLTLLEWLWRVVYADGRMDAHEEHLVRRIADLLHIRHADYIKARHKAGETI